MEMSGLRSLIIRVMKVFRYMLAIILTLIFLLQSGAVYAGITQSLGAPVSPGSPSDGGSFTDANEIVIYQANLNNPGGSPDKLVDLQGFQLNANPGVVNQVRLYECGAVAPTNPYVGGCTLLNTLTEGVDFNVGAPFTIDPAGTKLNINPAWIFVTATFNAVGANETVTLNPGILIEVCDGQGGAGTVCGGGTNQAFVCFGNDYDPPGNPGPCSTDANLGGVATFGVQPSGGGGGGG